MVRIHLIPLGCLDQRHDRELLNNKQRKPYPSAPEHSTTTIKLRNALTGASMAREAVRMPRVMRGIVGAREWRESDRVHDHQSERQNYECRHTRSSHGRYRNSGHFCRYRNCSS